MARVVCIVQLPFPRLDYLPDDSYFARLEDWYQAALGPECVIPGDGLWEPPPWIAWIRAALCAVSEVTAVPLDIRVLDLSRAAFDRTAIAARLDRFDPGTVFLFSPLLQNLDLTEAVAQDLLARGMAVGVGGHTLDALSPMTGINIFAGRIESAPTDFLSWMMNILREPTPNVSNTRFIESLGSHLSYSWAAQEYSNAMFYLRTFSHHGCPFACTFCDDRLSPVSIVPPPLLTTDLAALATAFPSRRALYIGDLTFGASPLGLTNLHRALTATMESLGVRYHLAVQTTLASIKPEFIRMLQELGVAVVELGIESADPSAVKRTKKPRPSVEWVEERMAMLLGAGIQVAGNIIAGLPDDGDREYSATESFIGRWRDRVWFNIYGYVPYPGTPMYSRLLAEHRITTWKRSEWCEGKPLVFEPYAISSQAARDWFARLLRATN